jgi:hypothetical protein
MSDFEQTLSAVNEHIQKSKDNFRAAFAEFRNAEELYKTVEQLRKQMLQDTLKENGLSVCAGHHFHDENSGEPTEEQLGIYPSGSMKLYYYQDPVYTKQGEYEDSNYRTMWLKLLCPEHLPQIPEVVRPTETGTEIKSEVIQKGDRFVLKVNGEDITELVNKGGLGIEPNGDNNPRVEVYRHFDIPDLPERPKFDSVKHGI